MLRLSFFFFFSVKTLLATEMILTIDEKHVKKKLKRKWLTEKYMNKTRRKLKKLQEYLQMKIKLKKEEFFFGEREMVEKKQKHLEKIN